MAIENPISPVETDGMPQDEILGQHNDSLTGDLIETPFIDKIQDQWNLDESVRRAYDRLGLTSEDAIEAGVHDPFRSTFETQEEYEKSILDKVIERKTEELETVKEMLEADEEIEEEDKRDIRKLAIGVAAAGLVLSAWGLEISPLNETIRADEGFEQLKTHLNIIRPVGAVALITAGMELGSSLTVVGGLASKQNMIRKPVLKSRDIMAKYGIIADEEEMKDKKNSFADHVSEASLAIGAGAAVAWMPHYREDMDTKRELLRATWLSACVTAYSSVLAAAISWGVLNAGGEHTGIEGVDNALEWGAEQAKIHGTKAWVWLAIAAAPRVRPILKKMKANREAKQSLIEQDDIELTEEEQLMDYFNQVQDDVMAKIQSSGNTRPTFANQLS